MSSNTNSSSSSILSKCAACGKGGDNLKVCTTCEQVCYCNAKCRNSHRSKHKKACKQYAAEIRNKKDALRAEVDAISEKLSKIEISDEELFADPPPRDDCDICFLPLPYDIRACGLVTVYQSCCGKTLCYGCMSASNDEMNKGNMKRWCPFCRVPNPKTDKELLKRLKKRLKMNDPYAFLNLGCFYRDGSTSLPQDKKKAIELWNRAVELGSVGAHYDLGRAYIYGTEGVDRDLEKALHHWKVAAIRGHEKARYALGLFEENYSMKIAMKHYMIVAGSGYDEALKEVGKGYKAGLVTKDDYASTLRSYQTIRDEMKSDQRTKASTLGTPSII